MEDFMPPPKKSKHQFDWGSISKEVHARMAESQVKNARVLPPPDVYSFELERYVTGYLARFRLHH